MYKSPFYIVAFLFSNFIFGQEHAPDETGVVMRSEITGGIHFNTRGWGFNSTYSFQKNYKYKHSVGLTFSNIRHEKEQKIFPDQILNSRGYYFGKLNSLVSLRPTYGGKLRLFQAKRENGIEISFKWDAGFSLGLLKPVYLRIDKLNAPTLDERYNPEIHNTGNISSRSSWFKGLGQAKFIPGAFLKMGFDFNFSPVKEAISGGEIGIMVDYFFTDEVEILYLAKNYNYYTALYLQFNFGRKLYF